MNSKIYDIVYSKLRTWVVPDKLRKPRLLAMLQVLTYPVEQLYQSFNRYRAAKNYQLYITPQVCYLERLLNDRYDQVSRRIRIVDSIDKPPTYFYRRDESKPVYVQLRSTAQPKYLFTRPETGLIPNDFVITVPASISFEDAEMISLVKGFRLAGKKIKIQRV